jgi:ferredoxin
MENIFLCYHCRECASECPVAFWFDVPPPRLVQYLQCGETERALQARTPWLCASCESCAIQCPHRLDLARVMADLTHAARDYGFSPRVVDAPRVSLPGADIRRRATELGLIPPSNQPLGRFAFELRWLAHRLGKRMRGLLLTRIWLPSATREHQPPTFAELLVAIAWVVLALPTALGFGVGLVLHYVSARGDSAV